MATDILTRSSRLPLRLHVGPGHYTLPNDTITNWMSWPVLRRVTLLHVDDPSYGDERDFERWRPIFSLPMPVLEDLSITMNLDDEPMRLPDGIWVDPQPKLTSLQLENCLLLDWATPALGEGLTNLSLCMSWLYEDVILPSSAELRDLFSRLTSLKSLRLSNFWPRMDTLPSDPFDFYPTLEDFQLDFAMEGMFATHYSPFWVCFRVPSTVCLFVKGYNDWGEDDEDHPELIDPITQVDNTRSPVMEVVIDSFQVKSYYTDTLSSALKPPLQHLQRRTPSHRTRSSRTLVCENSIVKFFIHRLPLNSLRTIFVTPDAMKRLSSLLPDGGWLWKFGPAPNVRRMSVYYAHSLALLDDLTKKDAHGDFSLFPLLETLIFHHDPKAAMAGFRTSLDLMLLELLAIRLEQNAAVQQVLVDGRMKSWSVWSKVDQGTTKVSFFEC